MSTVVIGEGDVDVAAIRAILPTFEVPKPTEMLGRVGAIQRAGVTAKTLNKAVVLVLDRNGADEATTRGEVVRGLRDAWDQLPAETAGWYTYKESRVRLVLAGLPNHEELRGLGITNFMMDDYLLALCLNNEALAAFCAGELRLSFVPPSADALKEILEGLAGYLRARRIPINSSKRFIDLIRAATGFQASRAIFAEKLISRCPEGIRDAVLGELRTAIAS